jgi:riboflavin kinase/FMN adenylyltransferase
MQIYHDWTEVPSITNLILTIGVFDGVHLGHRQIFEAMKQIAAQVGGETLVFTFDRNPLEIINPQNAPQPIVDLPTKTNLLQDQDIDHLLIQRFSPDFAELTAHDFIHTVLVQKLQAHTLVLGEDFRFGKNRQGDAQLLRKMAKLGSFQVVDIKPLRLNESVVSSTRIRQLLSQDQIATASNLLGWDYRQYLFKNIP